MNRTDRRRVRQEEHHSHQISRARNARHRLAAACQYLIAEVSRAGDAAADRATEMVLAYVRDLRNRTDDEGNRL